MLYVFSINQIKLVARTLTATDILRRGEYDDSGAAFNIVRDNIATVVAPAAILVHNSVTVPIVNTTSGSNSWRYSVVREDVGLIYGH
jgi:hypothetical protein